MSRINAYRGYVISYILSTFCLFCAFRSCYLLLSLLPSTIILYESKFEAAVDLGNCRNLCKLGIGILGKNQQKQQDYNDVVKYIFQ